MAVFDNYRDMYDIKLKPRLLRNLIKDHIPDENHPFQSPLKLSTVVPTVKTHRLLVESVVEALADRKLVEAWKGAVDAWIERVLILLSSNMPDKCWAGICLLGVTCQECSPDRFVASYSAWFHKLLLHIQSTESSHIVKVASCASASDLFTRLDGFPTAKKDGTSHAGKLIQPLLKLLNEDSSEVVWEAAVCLLHTIITFFPSSVHRHYDNVEAAIVSKVMSGKCSAHMLKKFAHCLASLPKSRGDEESWSLMIQKILLAINLHLNDAFRGLEEETKGSEAVKLLVPPGKGHPPPLGGQTTSGDASEKATKRSEQLEMSRVSTLMLCCCTMLTNSYPFQVSVPVRPMLAIVERVLMVDGSVSEALLPFMTAMQQEFICSELPDLHLHSLELLAAVTKGVRSQLVPYAADIVRLLMQYFKKCALPKLRMKVYSIMKILLISNGVGIAVYLAQDVITNAVMDLDSIGHKNCEASSSIYAKSSAEALLRPSNRKRKHVARTEALEEQHDKNAVQVEVPKHHSSTTSVKIAALEALEALLTVGGALRSESWRSNVDHLLITVATTVCDGGWANEERNVFLPDKTSPTWADLQLIALRALLASLLSPSRVRPPYLVQGLELFRRGRQETGTKLSEFCAHALLALEAVIHPRSLPLVHSTAANKNSFEEGLSLEFLSNEKQNPFFGGSSMGHPDSGDDDLYDIWLTNNDEIQNPDENIRNDVNPDTNMLLATHSTENLTEVPETNDEPDTNMSFAAKATETPIDPRPDGKSDQRLVVSVDDLEKMEHGDGIMVESREFVEQSRVEMKLHDVESESTVGTTILDYGKVTKFVSELDNESSMDPFPDIIDVEPDSD